MLKMTAMVNLVGTETVFKRIHQTVCELSAKNWFPTSAIVKVAKIWRRHTEAHNMLKMTAMVDLVGTETVFKSNLQPFESYQRKKIFNSD